MIHKYERNVLQVEAGAESADEAEVVVHERANGEDVGRVDAGADNLQPNLVILGSILQNLISGKNL
jgi:hypothetical protein